MNSPFDILEEKEEPCIMRERDFQSKLIKEMKKRYPGSIITKMDAGYLQGIPDLLILFGKKWAALECKRSAKAAHQPNQEYYCGILDKMSFARFINPSNKDEILNELDCHFKER